MARKINIRFPERGGVSPPGDIAAGAELLEDRAPLAADLLWGLLATPFVGQAVHAMYAGPAALIAIPERHGEPRGGQIPVENETAEPAPGDLLLLPPDPTLEQGASGVTIAIFHGAQGRPLTPAGWVPGVRVGHLMGDSNVLLERCRRLRFEGASEARLAREGQPPSPGSAILHVDGSSLGNPGPAGAGFVLTTPDGEVIAEGSIPLAPTTVNVAEYRALIAGLAEAERHKVDHLVVRMDSELVCRQLSGQYRVKSPELRPLYDWARKLMARFEEASCEHVPREANRRADELATAASRKSQERLENNAD